MSKLIAKIVILLVLTKKKTVFFLFSVTKSKKSRTFYIRCGLIC